jgi:dihydroorotate dehydrogenase
MVRRILEGLQHKLEEQELASFSDAIGIENQQSYSNPK